jgi:outer membrane receptor protein involved in Fe transport
MLQPRASSHWVCSLNFAPGAKGYAYVQVRGGAIAYYCRDSLESQARMATASPILTYRPSRSGATAACLFGAMAVLARAEPPPTPPDTPVESITVTSEKLTLETRIDRKIYSVAGDAQSAFGTASDILGAIPSIDVDADGILSLRGDSNVLILIDGKPSALLSGSSAGDNLQSIPAKDIERIEVITTPPPQYKAQGAAGVINIITRKRRPPGIAGSVQASYGTEGRYEIGSSTSLSYGPWSGSLSATYRQDLRNRISRSDLYAVDGSGVELDNRSTINEIIHRAVPPVSISVEYALNERQSVSVGLGRTGRAGLRTYTELNSSALLDGTVTQSGRRLSRGHDREIDYDEKLGFTQKFARPGETLELTLHRTTSHEVEHYDYTNDSFIPPAATTYDDLGFREDHASSELDADYALPVDKTRTLKLGYAFEQDVYGYGANGGVTNPATGSQSVDPMLDDLFHFRQEINALYLSYQAAYGKFEYLAGARAEYTETNGRQLTLGLTDRFHWMRLYPSLHLDYHLDEQNSLFVGAGRRVTRPDPSLLNPYVDYEYTPNLRAGNALLRPQYTNSFETGYNREAHGAAYLLAAYYRRNVDGVTDLTEDLGNGLSLTTKTNLPRNNSAGLEFSATGKLVHVLTYSLSGNFFYNEIDATALGASGLTSTTGINGKFKLDYRPSEDDSIQFLVTRTDKRLTPQGYVSAVNLVNLGYKRRMGSDLTAILTVSDAFNGQRYQRVTTTPAFTDRYEREVRGKVIWFGVVYAFGAEAANSPKFEYDQSTGP